MKIVYQLLADLTVTFHFAYVAFVVFGLFLTFIGGGLGWKWVRHIGFRTIHLLMIGIVVLESWFGIVCPLTTLENALRRRAGELPYRGDFVAQWLHDLMFFEASPWVFTLGYTLFGAAVLASWVFVPPRRRMSP